MSGSVHKTAVVIDALNFRRARVESFLATWAQYEDVDLISIAPDQASEKLAGAMDCRMLIYNTGGASCSSPKVLSEINELHALQPDAALVIVTDDASLDGVSAAFNAGAQGYFDNAMRPGLALQALSFVLHGGTYFPPAAILNGHSVPVSLGHTPCNGKDREVADIAGLCDDDRVITAPRTSILDGKPDTDVTAAQLPLTARQVAVVSCLCVGDSNKVIARKLGMTETTVKVHVREVMRKLGVSNRTQVALTAAQKGFWARNADEGCQDDGSGRFFRYPH
jgi:DNA-binding NarL/FixJ family response regulator